MIIVRTPLRVSLFGGGSDLDWFSYRNGGQVVSFTIDKYIYQTIHPMFNSRETLLKYSTIERVVETSNIQHNIFREVLTGYGISGVDIGVSSDVPAGTGLGSSSSFTVGLVHLVRRYLGLASRPRLLSQEACRVEIDRLNSPIGRQDQYAASYGGFNRFIFGKSGKVRVERQKMSEETRRKLEQSFFLVPVGVPRSASQKLMEQREQSRTSKAPELLLKELVKISEEVTDSTWMDLDRVGSLINRSWKIKREISSNVTSRSIDSLISHGLQHGSSGAKLLGAGGSGFVLFLVKPNQVTRFKAGMNGNSIVPVRMSSRGSRVIFTDR